jgi:hypothetical protein
MFRRLTAIVLILSLAAPAHAGLVPTESALERERISVLLERAEVQAALAAYGVSPAEARSRVVAMTDAEVEELAARIDELPAGGIGIIGAALVVFLVLLLTDILGYTKIFPFTKPMK